MKNTWPLHAALGELVLARGRGAERDADPSLIQENELKGFPRLCLEEIGFRQ